MAMTFGTNDLPVHTCHLWAGSQLGSSLSTTKC